MGNQPVQRESAPASKDTVTRRGASLAERVADAAASARRGSCCVANFANVPLSAAKPPKPRAKLKVNATGDRHERQADAFADRVTRLSDNGSSSSVQGRMTPTRDGGNMDDATRAFMQRGLGADFSDVRLHTDARADALSRGLNARAFTYGRDIYFAAGEFAPASSRGRHLLAHELTHTIQQRPTRMVQRVPNAQAFEGTAQAPAEDVDYKLEAADAIEPVAQMVQRSTKWSGATVHEDRNVAELALGAPSPVSWPMLNGTMLKQEADADKSIQGNQPTIATSGADKSWKAKVDTVPSQEGAVDESVLTAGPWTKATTRDAVGTALGLAKCVGTDSCTLTAIGKPSDDAVYKANRRHEDRHVTDNKASFDETVVVWDKKVQDAKDNGTEFGGTSAADATAKLWAAMGDTPQNTARKYRTTAFAKGDAFHKTAAGGTMKGSNPQSNDTCSTASIDATNPS